MDDKIFALLSEGEHLQELNKASQKVLVQQAQLTTENMNKGIARMQAIVNTMPEEARRAVLEAFQSDIAEPLQGTRNALNDSLERSKATVRTMAYFTGLMATFFCVFIALFAYFGIDWLIEERAELKREYNQLDHELAKIAEVLEIEGLDGHYVYIDPSRDNIHKLKNGRTVAKLPRR